MPPSRRQVAARTSYDYDPALDSGFSSGVPENDKTICAGVTNVQIVRPQWEKGPLIFRPFPVRDLARPNEILLPGRIKPTVQGLSPWPFGLPAANFIGTKDKFTFFLAHPKDQAGRKGSPYSKLYWAAEHAKKEGTFASGRDWKGTWNKLLEGKKPALTPPSTRWRIQAAIYMNGDKPYLSADRDQPLGLLESDPLPVVDLSSAAGRALLELVDTYRQSEFEGDVDKDPSLPFKYGDPVGRFSRKHGTITGGLIYHVYNPQRTTYKSSTSFSGKIAVNQGYETHVSKKWIYDDTEYTADLDEDQVAQIFEKVEFWLPELDKKTGEIVSPGLFHIPTYEEQMVWIAKAFSDVPRLLQFALADNPEFFTDDVNAILRQRTSAVMPGGDEEDRPRGRDRDEPRGHNRLAERDDEELDDEDDELDDEGNEFEDEPAPARSSRRDPTQNRRQPHYDPEDEEAQETPRGRSRSRTRDEFDDEVEEGGESEEEPEDNARPARLADRKPARGDSKRSNDEFYELADRVATGGKRRASGAEEEDEFEDDDEDADDEDILEDEDEPQPERSKSKVRGRRPQPASVEEDDEEDAEDEKAPLRGKGRGAPEEDEEEEELEEEEEPEEESEPAPAKRGRGRPPKSAAASPAKEEPARRGSYFPKALDKNGDKAKSMEAARAAKGRSAQRDAAPKKPAPAPPRSKGGTASRKKPGKK